MLCDTHTHLYDEAFDRDLDAVVERASQAGVGRMFLPAIDSGSHMRLFALAGRYAGTMFPMMGLHPTSVNDNPDWRKELDLVEHYLDDPPVERFYAVGETGLDMYWSKDFRVQQTEAFEHQIALAHKHSLPIVIHVREAMGQTLDILERNKHLSLHGVVHAWSGSVESYRRIRELGDFAFGIGGVATFKGSALPKVVEAMDICHIVLETDSPYLTPAPHRGKRNESAHVRLVCNRVAEIKSMHPDEVAHITSGNAARIFGL